MSARSHVGIFAQSDFGVAEIAGGIGFPWVAGELERTDSRVAAANGLIGARPAPSLEGARPHAQPSQYRIGQILPDDAERPAADTVDCIVRPVRVRVDHALRIDIGNSKPRRVSAPCFQMLPQMRHPFGREMLCGPLEEIDGIGVVVARHDVEIVGT